METDIAAATRSWDGVNVRLGGRLPLDDMLALFDVGLLVVMEPALEEDVLRGGVGIVDSPEGLEEEEVCL